MPILFIAVQCVQCSTMQVRQQNKSSNKWVCVVCNQRQSVLRIHARGLIARELRNFVQEFNLSRMKEESGVQDFFRPTSDGIAYKGRSTKVEKKSTSRWSEYLDDEEDAGETISGDDLEDLHPLGDCSRVEDERWRIDPPGGNGVFESEGGGGFSKRSFLERFSRRAGGNGANAAECSFVYPPSGDVCPKRNGKTPNQIEPKSAPVTHENSKRKHLALAFKGQHCIKGFRPLLATWFICFCIRTIHQMVAKQDNGTNDNTPRTLKAHSRCPDKSHGLTTVHKTATNKSIKMALWPPSWALKALSPTTLAQVSMTQTSNIGPVNPQDSLLQSNA
ncbi:hypothetical protein KSP40_PGU000716 [Platanthera guangdongensis]|uniref:MRN complex-interacting protein N-terminal domain-containing protein n=1 Tax=Platanthera guangdongensis TaxID=2320717 RepID=A0ABR2LHU2_9ASPA